MVLRSTKESGGAINDWWEWLGRVLNGLQTIAAGETADVCVYEALAFNKVISDEDIDKLKILSRAI